MWFVSIERLTPIIKQGFNCYIYRAQIKTFRNNTNNTIQKRMKEFAAEIRDKIEKGILQDKPEAPVTMTKFKPFAIAHGFNEYQYGVKFEKMIATITSISETRVLL